MLASLFLEPAPVLKTWKGPKSKSYCPWKELWRRLLNWRRDDWSTKPSYSGFKVCIKNTTVNIFLTVFSSTLTAQSIRPEQKELREDPRDVKKKEQELKQLNQWLKKEKRQIDQEWDRILKDGSVVAKGLAQHDIQLSLPKHLVDKINAMNTKNIKRSTDSNWCFHCFSQVTETTEENDWSTMHTNNMASYFQSKYLSIPYLFNLSSNFEGYSSFQCILLSLMETLFGRIW